MTIFLVTVLRVETGEERHRTWGWYLRFEDAEKSVLENHTDIFERGYYSLAVIEEYPERVCAVNRNSWWYQATYTNTDEEPVVKKIDVPEDFTQICCIAF